MIYQLSTTIVKLNILLGVELNYVRNVTTLFMTLKNIVFLVT